MDETYIIKGLQAHDETITKDYFYANCHIAYALYNQRYQLESKPGLDFYSIAHEYYLTLAKHNFKQLEDRNSNLSLRTWMVNGFRFTLLDRLEAYNREMCINNLEERSSQAQPTFDVADPQLQAEVRHMVEDLCDNLLQRDTRSAILLKMMLIEGFKGKEVAEQLGITPAAVSQNYHRLMNELVIPFFKQNFHTMTCEQVCYQEKYSRKLSHFNLMPNALPQRITPPHIECLAPDQIFVFGSNLGGMHGGGASRTARLYFGARIGIGQGLQGQSYAIPTMQGGVDTIQPYVNDFTEYARQHPELEFMVTAIGCGIAGFSPNEIAPLFAKASLLENVWLPEEFWKYL